MDFDIFLFTFSVDHIEMCPVTAPSVTVEEYYRFNFNSGWLISLVKVILLIVIISVLLLISFGGFNCLN